MKNIDVWPELSIILPCLNEEESLTSCIYDIQNVIDTHALNAEIIVVDNGSTDNSLRIAQEQNVISVIEPQRGYGAAYLRGFDEAKGTFIFLADSDGSYDFKEIPKFLNTLKHGTDFVIGNRFDGTIDKGAMPRLHQYLGNPLLSAIVRLLFKTDVRDVHCGMRAVRRQALRQMNLKTTGMEFASEMVIAAAEKALTIEQLPINYHKRKGRSKLKSLADGWRHLKCILLAVNFQTLSSSLIVSLPGIKDK